MNTHDIELFEALLRAYELDCRDYDALEVKNFADAAKYALSDKGIEDGEEVEALDFMYDNADNYAQVLEDRENDRWLAKAIARRRYDPFYQII